MNTNIKDFCTERKLSKQLEDAFTMYVRSTYANKFMMRNGDTIQLIVQKLTKEQITEAWSEFVMEMRNTISLE